MPHPLSMPIRPFVVTTTHLAGTVVLSLRGELDVSTVPVFSAALSTLDDEASALVLDLTELDFLGAAGLNVIAGTADLQSRRGASLTVVSASPVVRRLLRVTDLDGLLHLVPPVAALGAEHLAGDRSAAVVAPVARLGPGPMTSGVGTGVLDAALGLVTILVGATMAGADGASVTLPRHGRMVTAASSDETVRRMDLHQYDTGQGPCLAAAAAGDWVHVESLSTEDRWPDFVPLALHEGIASILSTPLLAADRPLGALNIYSNTDRAFGPEQQELAALFATQVSSVVAEADTEAADQLDPGGMGGALRDRSVIAQAQGVLMARDHLSEYEAAAVLHRSARATMSSVARLAAEVVSSTRGDVGPEPLGSGCG